ncbi:MAG: mismatch repair protein MutS [Rickettsiaceae bacterium]|jgi:DNA mismatch repair protein MutS|nr:mismatch repair protein MutS [Rickettsiaceae bacterium]
MPKLSGEYLDLKQSYPDHILLYRIGAFYELYFDDAILVAKALNIVLGNKKIVNQTIPTCGFPVKSLNNFANHLLQSGFKIAIAEQFRDSENPKKISRKISKFLTPGTFIDDDFLNITENILLAIAKKGEKFQLCFGNILLGEFFLGEIEQSQINQYLEMLKPSEILFDEKDLIDQKFHSKITFFVSESGFKINKKILEIFSKYHNQALCILFNYISQVHDPQLLEYFKIEQFQRQKYLKISAKTRQNLQLGEVVKMIDKTSCGIGKRFLQKTINQPLADALQINARLDAVEFLRDQNSLANSLQKYLKNLSDLEKITGKIAITQNANLQDLSLILESVNIIAKISEILFWQKNDKNLPAKLVEISQKLSCNSELINSLAKAVEPGNIRDGFDAVLDKNRNLYQKISQEIGNLEKEYQEVSKIKNLKIEFSDLPGFYFEIKRDKASEIKIPQDWQLLQNLSNSIRFSSTKLKSYQLEKVDLQAKIQVLEASILQDLTKKVLNHLEEIKANCKAIGELDLLLSFTVLAKENNFVKPIVTNKNQLKIIGGKHLISDKFIANDCELGEEKIWLLTGANMAGKSTFLRQNTLIILLAQMGCFVPAIAAEIGVRKQIFAKINTKDDLSKNQSGFMAEMQEIAEILKNSDTDSFVIIDELCQTTNVVDGENIAFNIIKYLLEHNQAWAIVSTHQTGLVEKFSGVQNIICKRIARNHRITNDLTQESSVFEIIKQIGLPNQIINNLK